MKGEIKIRTFNNYNLTPLCYTLEEPSSFYNYGQNKIDNYHDKTFKNLFSNQKEAVKFINKHLQLEKTNHKIKSNQLEKQNTNFITKYNEQLETDILYRIRDTKIFILIEHQSTVDYFMAKRILYYSTEIMREMEKEIDCSNKKILPIIYPIVLYTGKTRWTAKTSLTNLQQKIPEISSALNLTYRLVDINHYTKEELLKEQSSIAKAMLLEKIKNKDELIEILEKIVKQKLSTEEKKFIMDLLTNIVTEEIGEEKAKELKEKLKEKVGEKMVTENLRNIFRMNYNEGVEKGLQKGLQKGIQTATHNFIVQMIKNKMSDKTILKLTKITQEELEKIKKSLF